MSTRPMGGRVVREQPRCPLSQRRQVRFPLGLGSIFVAAGVRAIVLVPFAFTVVPDLGNLIRLQYIPRLLQPLQIGVQPQR